MENRDKLVYSPEEENRKWIAAANLEPLMVSAQHDSAIANIFPAARGQGYRIVLENGIEFPLDRDDGLEIKTA